MRQRSEGPCGSGAATLVESFAVRYDTDRVWAARRVVDAASGFGLGRRECAELAVIVCELVSNAVKFGGGGWVSVLGSDHRVQVEVVDRGPGVEDPERAVLDGYSEGAMWNPDEDPRTRRGLGSGLAAVKRFADEMSISGRVGGGARVVAVKVARGR